MGLGFKPMGMCDAATSRKKGIRGQVIVIFLTTWSSLFGSQAFDYLPVSAVESSASWLETQPQQQVHLVFSSHLVSCIPLEIDGPSESLKCHRALQIIFSRV